MASLFAKPRKTRKPAEKPSRLQKAPVAAEALASTELGLLIQDLSHDGRGVTRDHTGKTLFVKGAVPQDRVLIGQRVEHARYAEAELETLLAPSPDRVTPLCRHFGTCGGCQLQHLSASAQRVYKQQRLSHLLDFPASDWDAPLYAEPWGYRRRARLGIKQRKTGQWVIGFREAQSAQIHAISECPVLQPPLSRLLSPLYELLPQLEGGRHIGHIEWLSDARQTLVILRWLRDLQRFSPADAKRWNAWAEAQGVQVWLQTAEGQLHDLQGNAASPYLEEEVMGLSIHWTAADFIQVNAQINSRMVEQAIDWLALSGQERVLDCFCGVGNFSLPLAARAAQVVGIEGVQAQVERARDNAQRLGLTQVEFYQADLSQVHPSEARWMQAHWDVVLLDPPRAGAAGLMPWLAQACPARILYVSCDPATLARDAEALKAAGYRIQRASMIDMFPQTGHTETMVLFEHLV